MTTMGSRDLARTLANLAASAKSATPLTPGATFVLAWPIHPGALFGAPSLASLIPPSASGPTAIEWRIVGDRASAHIAIGETRIAVPGFEASLHWELDSESLLWSVDATRDGRALLSATIAPGEPARLLYVRTPIFEHFKIPGGRYGPAISRVVPAS